MKSLKKFAFWFMIALVIIVSILTYYVLSMNLHSSDVELKEEISKLELNAQVKYYEEDTVVLRYLNIANRDKTAPILLTLHGAPGSCSDYSIYWTDEVLRSEFEIISLDRPGYGGSVFSTKDLSIEVQAQMIMKMVVHLAQDRRVVILSHSYGGPIGTRLASLLGNACLGHVMVAPVLDPTSEEIFWYSSIPAIPPFSWFASEDWKSATSEKLSHVRQLRLLQPRLKDISSMTIHVHGTKDWLAPFENVAFAQANLPSGLYQSIVIEEGSHFILWEGEIAKKIKEQILLLKKSANLLMSQ